MRNNRHGIVTAVVVENEPHVLQLRSALLKRRGISVVAKVRDGDEALRHLRDCRPALAVMSILIAGKSVFDLLHSIRHENLQTRVILIAGSDRSEWVIRALEGGVFGYLIKPNPKLLDLALGSVLAGERFFGPRAIDVLTEAFLPLHEEKKTQGLLTPREIEVLKHRVSGKRVKEIACAINVSPKTAEKHIASVKRKLNAQTEADLVRFALKTGLVAA